jgi:hypothetical protein
MEWSCQRCALVGTGTQLSGLLNGFFFTGHRRISSHPLQRSWPACPMMPQTLASVSITGGRNLSAALCFSAIMASSCPALRRTPQAMAPNSATIGRGSPATAATSPVIRRCGAAIPPCAAVRAGTPPIVQQLPATIQRPGAVIAPRGAIVATGQKPSKTNHFAGFPRKYAANRKKQQTN